MPNPIGKLFNKDKSSDSAAQNQPGGSSDDSAPQNQQATTPATPANTSQIKPDPPTVTTAPQAADPNAPKKDHNNPYQSDAAIDSQKRAGIDVLTRLTQRSNQALMNGVNKAKELNSQYIDTEHALWGLITDPGVFKIISEFKVTPGKLQKDLEATFKKGDFKENPQFSPRVKRAFDLSLSAARSLGYEFISPEHLLLALAQEGEGVASQIMAKHGLTVEVLNKKITGDKKEGAEGKDGKTDGGKDQSAISQFTHDLTEMARQGKLDPVVARSPEIERLMHILSRRTKNNPVLIGEAGVGKNRDSRRRRSKNSHK